MTLAARGTVVALGTRGSALALAQAALVRDRLGDGVELRVELRVVRTTGDASDRPLAELGDAPFADALETALRRGEIDVAVHSLKDLPTAPSPGLRIAAVLARADPRDAVITRDRRGLAGLSAGAVVGTSSPRRAALLRDARPDLVARGIRGNVDTRLRKLDAREYDAVALAVAGLSRLGIALAEDEPLDPVAFPPAPGQGAIAVQCRDDDAATLRRIAALDDAASHECVDIERALLARLGGGCALALGAWARRVGAEVALDAALAEGDTVARASARDRDASRLVAEVAGALRGRARA